LTAVVAGGVRGVKKVRAYFARETKMKKTLAVAIAAGILILPGQVNLLAVRVLNTSKP